MDTHLKLHSTQLKQLTEIQTNPLNNLNAHSDPPRNMTSTIFHNNEHTNVISKVHLTPEECKENLKHIHTTIISQYLSSRKNNKVTNTTLHDIHSSEQTLPHHKHTKLHSSGPTYHHSCKVTYIQYAFDTYTLQCWVCLTHT